MNQPALDPTKIAAARLWAATRAPYLASALFACTPIAAGGSGTVAVDRDWRLHVDPVAIAEFDAAQLGRLLLHLTGHLVRDHADRAMASGVDDGSAGSWGRCTDAEINDDLVAADLLPPVANLLPSDLNAADGQLAETYFAIQAPPAGIDGVSAVAGAAGGADWDCGSGADGRPRPWDGDGHAGAPGLTSDQAERLRHAVAEEVRRAHEADPGSVPAGWLRWAETVLRSRTDWRRVIAAEIRRAVAAVAGSVDYTYRRPSRRSHSASGTGQRVVLPSLYRPVPEVAIVCDTSGSMDEALLAQVLAEVEAIVTRAGLRASGVTTLAVDTTVHAARRVHRASEVSLLGGGGTDMGAGIAAALERRPRPEVIVVLTDGFTPWPTSAPRGVRVVVGVLTSPFGRPEQPPSWARTVTISG